MMISNKTIVIISPDSWGFITVSKHHYAIELAKHNKVYYVNPSCLESDFIDKGVTIINQYKKIRGIRFFPKIFRRLIMKLEVRSIISKVYNQKIDIVWSFDTSRLYYLDLFNSEIKIAHIMDYTEHFYFNELVGSADYCLSVADCISEKMIPYSKKIFKINHGYYSKSNEKTTKNHATKTGIYIGNLSMDFIDWNLITLLAKENPFINFKFFGPINRKQTELNPEFVKASSLTNIEILNQISPDEVIDELRKNYFCLVMYKHKEFGRQLDNSHKIMQYLGSGTPIFSSFTYEYRDSNLFTMYMDEADVSIKFKQFILNEFGDFSEESRQKRINFALDNTYPKQIERIAKIIYSN